MRTCIPQPCICFIALEDRAKAELVIRSLGWPITLKEVALRLFDGRDALACYLPSGWLYRWRDALRGQHVGVWELDIRPTDRYLMERFVAGGAVLGYERLEAYSYDAGATNSIGMGSMGWQDALETQIKPGNYRPKLKCLSIDIETSYPRVNEPDRLFSIGFYAPDFSLVLMIDSEFDSGQDQDKDNDSERQHQAGAPDSKAPYYEAVRDEITLLKRFLEVVADYDPDVIIGWNFIQFDMAFLRRKFEQYDLAFTLGRDGSELEWRQSKQKSERIFLHTPGRVILDGIECLKNATWHFESFALDHVSQVLIDDSKLLHGEERGSDIERLFEHDKATLATYNLKDCELVWRIFSKTNLLEFLIERSHMTGLLMDRMGGSVAAFEHMYLPRLHRKGWVAPNLGDGYSAEKSPGGYVMDSVPGLYEHVLVLDFKSLYPSIIRTFCIDPLGLIEGMSRLGNGANIERGGDDIKDSVSGQFNGNIPGYFGGEFHRENHVLPDLIRHLGELRETAKAQGNTPLSQAIKIIMASCYGILGSDGCRFYDTRLAASITKRGHDIIQRTTQWIREQGYDVIYGDTDSVFVWLKTDVTDAKADVIGHRLVKDINAWLTAELQREFGLESFLELEYETHYRRFFMPSIRGAETGSKKRYAGIKAGSEELIFKGLEAVRSDWTPLAREFQKELYRRIFYKEPWQEWLKSEVRALLAGERDDLLIYRKRLRRPLTDYQRSRPPHAKAAAVMDRWLESQGRSARYQDRGGWVSYLITTNGPEPEDIRHSAIDYGHYLEKQLQPVAEAMFQFTGDSFVNLTSSQHRLF